MKSYLDLIPISAKVHRRQTRMTRLCILISAFLVAAVFGMADMFLQSQKLQALIERSAAGDKEAGSVPVPAGTANIK